MSTISSSADPHQRPSRLATAIACAALLVVPLLAWLLVPSSAPPPRPTATRAEAAPPPPVATTPDDFAGPTHPASLTPAPRPIQVAPAEQAVKGTVVDPDGHGVEGATVVCKTNGTSVTTDASGRFAFGSNAVGCEAVAMHDGFAPSDPQNLAAGDDNELRLQKGGSVHGVVVDDGGAPVRSFTVAIELFSPAGSSDYGSLAGKTKSANDPDGAFTWDGLAAGTYVFAANAQGHGMGKSDRVTVEKGKTAEVKIQLARATSVSGKVTDADTKAPVEGATVTLDGEAQFGGAAPPEATTDRNGAFTLEGVPAGRFSVRVSDPEYRTVVAPGDASGDQHPTLDVTLHKSAAGSGYEMIGVGLFVGGGPKGLWVFGLMPGSPAEKAGIQSGDLLLAIDGARTDKMTVAEANNRLRGPEGTVVKVRYSHAGAEGEAALTCARVVH